MPGARCGLPGARRGRDQAQALIRTRVQPAQAGTTDWVYPVQAAEPPPALAAARRTIRAVDPGWWPQGPGGQAGSPAMGTCHQMLHPRSSHAAVEQQSPAERFRAGQRGQVPGRIRIPGRLSWPAEGSAGQCVADWLHCSRADLRQAAGADLPGQSAGAGSLRQAAAGSPPGQAAEAGSPGPPAAGSPSGQAAGADSPGQAVADSPPGTLAARLAEPAASAADLLSGPTAAADRSGHQAE